MCDPVSISVASLALTTASAAASYHGQVQQAEAQADYQEAQAEVQNQMNSQAQEAAMSAYADDTYQQNLRIQQEREASALEIQRVQREAVEKRGTAVASSQGMADALMADFMRQEARYRDSVRHNFDMTALQVEGQKDTSYTRAQNRINQNSAPYVASPITQPDAIGAGLKIAQGGLNSYTSYKKRTPKSEGGWA